MVIYFKQVAGATTAQSLTTAFGFSEPKHITKAQFQYVSGGSDVVYGGGSNVTNVPANVGFFYSNGASMEISNDGYGFIGTTDDIYIVCSAATGTSFITIYAG